MTPSVYAFRQFRVNEALKLCNLASIVHMPLLTSPADYIRHSLAPNGSSWNHYICHPSSGGFILTTLRFGRKCDDNLVSFKLNINNDICKLKIFVRHTRIWFNSFMFWDARENSATFVETLSVRSLWPDIEIVCS